MRAAILIALAFAASGYAQIQGRHGYTLVMDGHVYVMRCISDRTAKAIAAKGGVIGIQFGSTFNNPAYYAWTRGTARRRRREIPAGPNRSGRSRKWPRR